MNTREQRLLWGVAWCFTLAVGWLSWSSSAAADKKLDDAFQQRIQLQTQLHTIRQHNTTSAAPVTQADNDVIPHAQQALKAIGLPPHTLTGVDPQPTRHIQTAGSNQAHHEAVIAIRLKALDINDLGRWLTAWQQQQHGWTLSEINTKHVQAARSRSARNSADATLNTQRYDARLVFVAPTWDEGTP